METTTTTAPSPQQPSSHKRFGVRDGLLLFLSIAFVYLLFDREEMTAESVTSLAAHQQHEIREIAGKSKTSGKGSTSAECPVCAVCDDRAQQPAQCPSAPPFPSRDACPVCPSASAAATKARTNTAATAAAGGASQHFPLDRWAQQSRQGVRRYADLAAAAGSVAEPMRWGTNVVSFVSGNNAMVKFMLNEMLHIAKHQVPFSILWVPLDNEALARLERQGNGTVWDKIATEGKYGAGRSNFREKAYNEMALVKWDISIALLELGYDVLLLDPDLVLLRNPLPYFETLGRCDISIQMDSLIDPSHDIVLSQGGYSFREEGFDNFFNTGGILMRRCVPLSCVRWASH